MLSGDKAYELFVSSEPFPLHRFLDEWRAAEKPADVGYVLAVIGAFNRMRENCHDGRYAGVIRR